jgi:hypothetical protein
MASPKSNMSFQQAVLMAARAQTKDDIKAEVYEAATVLTNETKKSLIAIKQKMDALETLLVTKLGVKEEEINEAVWSVQEKLYGLELAETPAALGNAIRFRVKEEVEGQETEGVPTQESYIVLGNSDNDQLPKEIIDALTGTVPGDVKKVTLHSDALKSNYVVTIAVDRVYKEKKRVGEAE